MRRIEELASHRRHAIVKTSDGHLAIETILAASPSLVEQHEIAIVAQRAEHLERVAGIRRRLLTRSTLQDEQRFLRVSNTLPRRDDD